MNRVYIPYPEASEHVHYQGAWASSTTYNVGDEVSNDGGMFVCKLAHVSAGATEPIPEGVAVLADTWASGETPSGTMDGSNQTFTLAHTPTGLLILVWNGAVLKEGAGNDFTISTNTITLLGDVKPELGDNLLAFYPY
jgi:hypothetical protein